MITARTWTNGLKNGLTTSGKLLRVILPVYAVVVVLGHTPVMGWLASAFEPVMRLAGLPGEAAVAFVSGAVVSMYAAVGITAALNLDAYQVTTLAVMLNLCHELPLETAILKKTGVKAWPVVLVRLGAAFLVGAAMHAVGNLLG